MKQVAIVTNIIDCEMIDAPTFERSYLFLAENEVMKNNVSYQYPSVANPAAPMANLES